MQATLQNLPAGLTHPDRDDRLIEGCKGLGTLVQLRVHPGAPLREVPHPANADAHLAPATESVIRALREEPLDPRLLSLDPDDLERRHELLLRTRRLLRAFTPMVSTLNLIVRNLEDGLDGDLRDAY